METITIAGRVLDSDDAALVLDALTKSATFSKKQSMDTNSNLTTGSKMAAGNKAKKLSRIVEMIKGIPLSPKSKQKYGNHLVEL
jgi:hypothetical protein